MPSNVAVPSLTKGEVLSGGWDVRWARVLRIDQVGSRALALIDGNGDGAELEAEVWCFDDAQWHCGASSGFGPLGGSGRMAGWSTGLAYKAGCAAPGDSVSIMWREGRQTVVADQLGLWVMVGELSERELGEGTGFPRWLNDM